MFKHDKLYVGTDVADREALCKRLTDNGATIVSTVGEQDSIHIFNSFEGVLFEDCLKKGYRIIGLPCLQQTLESGKALPRTPYPVYSRVMEGIVVSSDVVEQKAKLKNYVHQMNGTWADDLSGDTQYFITNEPGSIHYMWALEYGSNIVQPSWITESWENRVLSNPKFHILPPLHGCVISVTGLSTGTRNTIQNLVTHYGGKPAGRKYVTALAWGVHVVNTNWLFDSINAKGTVDVSRYEVPQDGEGLGDSYTTTSGNTLYLRSPYSRSSPYGSSLSSHHHLSSTRSRLVGSSHVAPILVRRHRTPAGASYTPLFSLPSTHPHQFAQTTQIQAGSHHSLGLTQSSLRSSMSQSNKPSSSRSRDKEGRSSMDKYRDMIDQVAGLLRMCDDIIEKSNTVQNTNSDINSFSNILNSSISSNIGNITNLYNNLNQLCNNNNNINNNNYKMTSDTTTTTTTTTSSNLVDTNINNNNTTTNNKDNSSAANKPSSISTTNKEENTPTDIEMESDEEPATAATPSEHEK